MSLEIRILRGFDCAQPDIEYKTSYFIQLNTLTY